VVDGAFGSGQVARVSVPWFPPISQKGGEMDGAPKIGRIESA